MQRTLIKNHFFSGKGLHSGALVGMTVCPADAGTGIVFVREDMGGVEIPAVAANVDAVMRSTSLSRGGISVMTVEHILSAFAGLGIDNAKVVLNGGEVPVLDGSAAPFVRAFLEDGLCVQDAEAREIAIKEKFEFARGDSKIVFEPAPEFSAEVRVDFGSRVMGVQSASFSSRDDYASSIAPCRTFCFFQELEYLVSVGMIKGGDMDNAIVIVEREVSDEQIARVAGLFGRKDICRNPSGYLSNIDLHFPNECARHKLLDLMGDLSLAGAPIRARITAVKPGHSINTAAVKALLASIDK